MVKSVNKAKATCHCKIGMTIFGAWHIYWN